MLSKETVHTGKDIGKHAAVFGLTAARLLIAERMSRKVTKKEPIGLEMAAFVVADIADGVLARKHGLDTPTRRFADAVVDRVSVLRVGLATAKSYPKSAPYFAGIAVREAVVASANAIHYVRTGEVVQGHGIHKLGTLSLALFGAVSSYGNKTATSAVGAATNLINAGLAVDYVNNAINPHGYLRDGVRHIEFGQEKKI